MIGVAGYAPITHWKLKKPGIPANFIYGNNQMKSGIVKHINRILEELPPGSPAYEATADLMGKFQEFFTQLQGAKAEEVESLLTEFTEVEQPLLEGLGKLVRKYHTQIQMVSNDVPIRLGEIAEHDMVNASERLAHIVTMTEKAANTTMELSETMIGAISERQPTNAACLEKIEAALAGAGLSPDAQQALQGAAEALRHQELEHVEHLQKLTDILMAQGYQDLTGQVVQKIVILLSSLEKELLELVMAFGKVQVERQKAPPGEVLEGPLSLEKKGRVSQDQADDLLNSLGF